MNRRQFLSMAGAFAGCTGSTLAMPRPGVSSFSFFQALVIVDLNGGNDGLNTVIPIADPLYRALRPTLALTRDRALTLDERTALHPSLRPLMSERVARERVGDRTGRGLCGAQPLAFQVAADLGHGIGRG
ncbi:hypothetical protein BSCH_01117c [Candidatus Paraburkholderia schumanniana]|nr:hypothetical protein BSCH_01117c [Candidatus Paraburkholderia schumannianae]